MPPEDGAGWAPHLVRLLKLNQINRQQAKKKIAWACPDTKVQKNRRFKYRHCHSIPILRLHVFPILAPLDFEFYQLISVCQCVIIRRLLNYIFYYQETEPLSKIEFFYLQNKWFSYAPKLQKRRKESYRARHVISVSLNPNWQALVIYGMNSWLCLLGHSRAQRKDCCISQSVKKWRQIQTNCRRYQHALWSRCF